MASPPTSSRAKHGNEGATGQSTTATVPDKLKVTPAMAAGVSKKLQEVADLVAVLEAAEQAPKARGTYKKRTTA